METSRDDFVIAIRSAFLKKGNQQRFSLLGLIFFSIIFMVLGSFNFKAVNYLKVAINEIVYRSSFIVSGPENFVKKNYSIITGHLNLYEDNKKNKFQLELLRTKDLSKKILILENTKYKKLIDDYYIQDNETYAKVLIDKQSPFLRSIIINKGSKNNIRLGMIVTDEGYLVGKIVEVNFFTSRVLLLSDINSKIPVSIQPGDIQAIMSGKGKKSGILQYIKSPRKIENEEESIVLTSGAGGVFKSGIPVGKIIKENQISEEYRIVDLYKDFSQLQYVKVVSFLKETESLDRSSKKDSKALTKQIAEENQKEETLRILLEQKKIAEEVRITIEEEINVLRNNNIKLQNQLLAANQTIEDNKIQKEDLKFIEMNILYGRKCKKTFYNNLYKTGTLEYKNCVMNKGLKTLNE